MAYFVYAYFVRGGLFCTILHFWNTLYQKKGASPMRSGFRKVEILVFGLWNNKINHRRLWVQSQIQRKCSTVVATTRSMLIERPRVRFRLLQILLRPRILRETVISVQKRQVFVLRLKGYYLNLKDFQTKRVYKHCLTICVSRDPMKIYFE